MTLQRQFAFWGLALAAFIALVYVFSPILLPFVLGMVVAYLLNPAVNALARINLGRGPASLLILFLFVLAAAIFFIVVLPPAGRELAGLYDKLPFYIERLKTLIQPASGRLESFLGSWKAQEVSIPPGAAANAIRNVAETLFVGGTAFLHLLSVIVITPVVAYFMMKEWPAICGWTESIMPRQSRETIMNLLKEIDKKLSGFIRGQATVALILALVYAVALTLAGLQYGFLIGLCAGLLSVIPMVGSTLGLVAGILVAWFQTYDWQFALLVAAIFLIGQLIEGNFLTPKLVGGRVGLHPLWIFFALMAGGALFGFLGVLLAVPVAAVVGVLVAFAVSRYKSSPYYTGRKNG